MNATKLSFILHDLKYFFYLKVDLFNKGNIYNHENRYCITINGKSNW